MFAVIAGAGGVYVWRMLPETRGRTLAEVQRLLESEPSCAPSYLLRYRAATLRHHACMTAEFGPCVQTNLQPGSEPSFGIWSRDLQSRTDIQGRPACFQLTVSFIRGN